MLYFLEQCSFSKSGEPGNKAGLNKSILLVIPAVLYHVTFGPAKIPNTCVTSVLIGLFQYTRDKLLC